MGVVKLICVKEKSKLRVRIISPGYLNTANCQFPRAIRAEGAQYEVDAEDITLARGAAGKYFYRVRKSGVKVLGTTTTVEKIFEEEGAECIICMDAPYDRVIVPCGHYCACAKCLNIIRSGDNPSCPVCRGPIVNAVAREMIG